MLFMSTNHSHGVLSDSIEYTISLIPHISAIIKSAYLELEKYENQVLHLLLKL